MPPAFFYVSVMEDKQSKQKYRYTKQLVRIALEQGYTAEDVLEKAGASRKSLSMFSKWRNGKALATVRQLQYFINEYEHLLKRKMEHLFYGVTDGELKYYKLNGELILKHAIKHPPVQIDKRRRSLALFRMLLLKEGNKFHFVFQTRVGLTGEERFKPSNINDLMHSPNEEANWFVYDFKTELTAESIFETATPFINQLYNGKNLAQVVLKNEAIALCFIIRQVLLKQGHQCLDIVDLVSKDEIIKKPKQSEEQQSS